MHAHSAFVLSEGLGWRIQQRLLLGILVGIAVLIVLPSAVGKLAYLFLTLHALRGPRQTIEAFALLALALLGNPAVFPDGAKMFRWAVLFAGFGRMLWDTFIGGQPLGADTSVLKALSVFAGTVLVLTFTVSWMPVLSLLKLVSFVMGVMTMFVCFYRTLHLSAYWRSWFLTYFAALILASLFMYPLGYGYVRTAEGFQGILNHPQVLGPICGVILAWATGYCVVRPEKLSKWWPFLIGGISLVFISRSRTGAVVVAGGLALSFLVFTLWRRDGIDWASLLRQPATWVGASVIGIVLLFNAAPVQEAILSFVHKGDVAESASIGEIYEDSRGALIQASMKNFRDAPAFGIGFGVPSDPATLAREEGYIKMQTVMGIPVSASSEKGFMPVAVLEEIGIVGAFLLLILMGAIAGPVLRFGSLPMVWAFWGSLLINVGEAVLLSIGGTGLLMWLVVAFCHAQAVDRRNRMAGAA